MSKKQKAQPQVEPEVEDSDADESSDDDEILEEEQEMKDDVASSSDEDSEDEQEQQNNVAKKAKKTKGDKDAEVAEKPEKKKREIEENKTIFVGNLPINTKDKQLKTFFEPFGTVKSVRLRSAMGKIIYKKEMISKDPCITAFVVFEEAQMAEDAVKKCPRKFKERKIRVNLASHKKGINRNTIFVGNLSYATVDEDLHEVFSTCGELESVRTIRGPSGCKGIAYVTFQEKSAVQLALELQGTRIRDRPIRLEKCRDIEKADKKAAQKEDEKNTKVVHKFVNGKHVQQTQKATPTNAGNALKRLNKKPGFKSDRPNGAKGAPQGRPGARGPPRGANNNRRQEGGAPGGEKGPRKPGYKPKAPKVKGLPKNLQMAKRLNVNWKKPTYKAPPKKSLGGAGGGGGAANFAGPRTFKPREK